MALFPGTGPRAYQNTPLTGPVAYMQGQAYNQAQPQKYQSYTSPMTTGNVAGLFSGTGGQGANPVNTGPQSAPNPLDMGDWQNQQAQSGLRNEISSAWDQYLSGLQGQEGFFNDQRTAQEGIANSQLTQGQEALGQQKASSLRDIANTTRNAFQAGNNYLGSLGAGDSSAANQYSFAINQQANKQTGDLNNFVTGEMQKLQSTHDQQIQSIAQWFAQQQEQLKMQIAEGGLRKGQDLANLSKGILDQAIQATNQLKTNSQNQYNALVSWAASNSQNAGQLQQNVANVNSMFQPGQIQTVGGQGNPAPMVGSTQANRKTDIFGRPIS